MNGASFQTPLALNTWASVLGGGLAFSSRSWAATDLSGVNLPTTIDGVSVSVNGSPAAISYVGPSQVDFLIPENAAQGSAQIQVINNGQASATATVNLLGTAPAFFWLTGNKYIASTHANGTLTGPATLISGETTPALGGETIVLYGTGFGATSPAAPSGTTLAAPLPLAVAPVITIAGVPATVTYLGLVEPAVYQINVQIPSSVPPGDAAVVATAGGQQSQANAFLSVQ